MTRRSDQLESSYLDTYGRHVITLEKKNVTADHIRPFTVSWCLPAFKKESIPDLLRLSVLPRHPRTNHGLQLLPRLVRSGHHLLTFRLLHRKVISVYVVLLITKIIVFVYWFHFSVNVYFSVCHLSIQLCRDNWREDGSCFRQGPAHSNCWLIAISPTHYGIHSG